MAQTPFWLEIKTEYIDANLDKEQNLSNLRLLGAWLLIQDRLATAEARQAYFFFLKHTRASWTTPRNTLRTL